MITRISADKLPELLRQISEQEKLYIPVDKSEKVSVYEEYAPGKVMSTKLNTLRSAKDFFFPQVQPMAKFRMEGKKIEVIDTRRESEDYCIFGVRACDVRSFDVLDRVFLADPVDTYYENRRKHATVVSFACSEPSETCFCHSFGIDAAKPAGDARMWMANDTIYLEGISEKGKVLLEKLDLAALDAVTDEKAEKDVEAEQRRVHEIQKKMPLYSLTPADNREKELEIFHSPIWKELSDKCLGCGSCTFVCPTCQCFDIEDFNSGHGVERYRCWDSCMYKDFTMMAAGTPRKTQLERFRQRFMHKLVYYPIRNDGMYSCVGCGRCLRRCPIHMNIVKVMKAMEEDAQCETKN
ncbi:MAG: 4Fe-4S dicluster domain-containing protein [Lachnospiraceae bacterium]|jgi:heterodisulfide reductase subunit C|nr:4Fe-4S dicluster domain-containing protein [Lachnospiraceae bacterium]MCH4030218.1 4Fe-4S dicluster domain-containing protein [Lachnospiraceae bacterium]MCH4069430.1 4Fe-4S dicluster domain-containing protein [Lachnospiraceae bacterium]MCH4107634.1 4Fe-4S dicluster domain-containing protein [Lachnospiraceae bacterium]MCI1301515.1 4Fe-4S dicluster domain-containing protein [Lachnospiraceae bacterium]